MKLASDQAICKLPMIVGPRSTRRRSRDESDPHCPASNAAIAGCTEKRDGGLVEPNGVGAIPALNPACDTIDNVNRDLLDHYLRAIAGTLAHFATSTDELR